MNPGGSCFTLRCLSHWKHSSERLRGWVVEGWGTNPFTFCWLVSFRRSGHDASADVEGFLIQTLSLGIKLPLRLRNLRTLSNSTSVQVIYGLVFQLPRAIVSTQENHMSSCRRLMACVNAKQYIRYGFFSASSHRLYCLLHRFWQLAVRTQRCTHSDLAQVRHSSLLCGQKVPFHLRKRLVWSESATHDQNGTHEPLEKQDQLMGFYLTGSILMDPLRSIQNVKNIYKK